jgi:hypothetical protein
LTSEPSFQVSQSEVEEEEEETEDVVRYKIITSVSNPVD